MYTFVTGFLKTFLYHTGFVYIRYISLDVFFPMYLHCLRSFFLEREIVLNTGLVYIRSYVFALYIFVTHFERCFVYIRYISLDVFFPMYLHCLRSFFLEREIVLNTGLVYIRSYVFALYIFVTHFERCI